jgi:hypothetical protein
MPNLHAAFEKYKNSNFAILSLSLDDSEDVIQKFRAAKWPMPWMHTILEGGASGAAYSPIGRAFRDGGRLWSIPRPILVGRDGTILATHFSLLGCRLDAALNKYLGKAALK